MVGDGGRVGGWWLGVVLFLFGAWFWLADVCTLLGLHI